MNNPKSVNQPTFVKIRGVAFMRCC